MNVLFQTLRKAPDYLQAYVLMWETDNVGSRIIYTSNSIQIDF